MSMTSTPAANGKAPSESVPSRPRNWKLTNLVAFQVPVNFNGISFPGVVGGIVLDVEVVIS
jgi:hypothetical protein